MESILFLGLNLYAWIVIVTILTKFTILTFTKLPADVVFMGGMAVLFVSGVLSTQEALAGFSAESVVTIGVLFVVVAGLTYTGVLQWVARYVLGTPLSYAGAVVRLMLPVAGLSAVLNNTSVVALFLNVVKVWGKKLGISPSRLLIPLSYASGMGGVCTLIGTPPNLIISGFYQKDTGETMNIFITTLPGLFCLVVGVISILVLRRLLPDRKSADDNFEATSDYTVELLVPSECSIIGQTVSEAGLVNVKGGRLIEIVRFDREIITPVTDDEFVMGGDRLIYSGQIEEILDLKRTKHLVNATNHVFSLKEIEKGRKLLTASIGLGCPLADVSMGGTDFEEKYGVVLVAVSRRGERITASPREIRLRPGDVLLLECPPSFKPGNLPQNNGLHFFDSDSIPNIGRKTMVSSLIMLGMILLSTFNVGICHAFHSLLFHRTGPQQHQLECADDICRIGLPRCCHRKNRYSHGIGSRVAPRQCQSGYPAYRHLPFGYVHHGIYQQHGLCRHVLPDSLPVGCDAWSQSRHLLRGSDDCRVVEFRHTYRFAYPYAGICRWWIPFYRLHEDRDSYESHYPGGKYFYRHAAFPLVVRLSNNNQTVIEQ